MAMSRFSAYLNRSSKFVQDNASRMIRMTGADEPSRAPITLFNFNTHEAIKQFATGCDSDVGGMSNVNFALDESTASPSTSNEKLAELSRPTAKFWGEMRLGVRHGLEGRIRGGYAGFRSKARTYLTSLFGDIMDDVSMHKFLALRVRAAGHPRTRNSYYVNIQTDGPITTDLWQHRLYFRRDDGGWEDIYIPFDAFVLTNVGEVSYDQIQMYRERVRTVGVSLLGGNSSVEGPYELGVDSIFAVNEEDVPPDAAPKTEPSNGTQWERPAV